MTNPIPSKEQLKQAIELLEQVKWPGTQHKIAAQILISAAKLYQQSQIWKEEDPRMLREQIRVADVAYQSLNERHKELQSLYDERCKYYLDLQEEHKATKEVLKEVTNERDDEIGEFQNKVRNLLMKRIPGCNPDGGGCESGDWRDFTISEIHQALNHSEGQCDQLKQDRDSILEDARVMVGALRFCFSVFDNQMGDTDLNNDDGDQMKACTLINKSLSTPLAKRIVGEKQKEGGDV